MEKFVYVFVAGISIFIAAFLLIGQGPVCDGASCSSGGYGSSSYYYRNYTTTSDPNIISYTQPISLDAKQKQTYRTINLGSFAVGFTQSDSVIKSESELAIEKSAFTENQYTVSFEKQGATEATLDFEIDASNYYGNLIIYFNDNLVFDAIPNETHYTFSFDTLKDTNTISIQAQSSGMKFWAPTVYNLKNLELSINSYSQKQKAFPFRIESYEFNSLDKIVLEYQVINARRNENLTAYVNGKEIYSNNPMPRAKEYKATFGKFETSLIPGENSIVFSSGKDSEYSVSDAQLNVYYFNAINPAKYEAIVTISDKQYDRIKSGTAMLAFDLPSVSNEGLRIFVNNKSIDEAVYEGKNTFPLHTDKIYKGRNTIVFQTLGVYQINNLEISIVDKIY